MKKNYERNCLYIKVYRYKFKIIVYCGSEDFLFLERRLEVLVLYGTLYFVILLAFWTIEAVKLINKDRNRVQMIFLLFQTFLNTTLAIKRGRM